MMKSNAMMKNGVQKSVHEGDGTHTEIYSVSTLSGDRMQLVLLNTVERAKTGFRKDTTA